MNYFDTLKIEESAIGSEGTSPESFKDIAEGVSRWIDIFCQVPDNYFAKAPATAIDRTFRGEGLDLLRLDYPLISTSITSILIDETELTSDNYFVKGTFAQFIKRTDGTFPEDEIVTINAQWGFLKTPSAIEQITRELTLYTWRTEDPEFQKKSELDESNFRQGLSPNSFIMLTKIRGRVSQDTGFY